MTDSGMQDPGHFVWRYLCLRLCVVFPLLYSALVFYFVVVSIPMSLSLVPHVFVFGFSGFSVVFSHINCICRCFCLCLCLCLCRLFSSVVVVVF
jgi:hypothetical protein